MSLAQNIRSNVNHSKPLPASATRSILKRVGKLAAPRGSHALVDDGQLLNLPDLRSGRTLDDAMRHLSDVASRSPSDYPAEWYAELEDFGGNATAMYDQDGSCHISVGAFLDAQNAERWLRCTALWQHMRGVPGARAAIIAYLEKIGRVSDDRPVSLQDVGPVIRAFLATGGRLMINPDGKVEIGGDMGRILRLDIHQAARERATRGAREMFRLWQCGRARPAITRFIRMLGQRTNNGWLVLERESVTGRG